MSLKVGELFASLGLDSSQFDKGMNNSRRGFASLGQDMTKIGKSLSAKVTAPLVGIGLASIWTHSKFKDSLGQVAAVTQATGDELERLTSTAKEMGRETKYSASQAADAMTYLGMAGWDTNQIITGLPNLLNLATASATDLAQAADITSDIMSGFGLEAEDVGRIADVLALTAASANTNVEKLGNTMKYAAPVANDFGLSMEETAAVAGKMADAGIKGSMAGTALRTALLALASPTTDAKDALETLGVAIEDKATGQIRSIVDIIADMEVGMGKLTQAEKLSYAATIFGTEASSAWLAVINGGADSLDELATSLENSTGAAKRMAETQKAVGASGNAFREMKSAIEGVAIVIGEKLEPTFIMVTGAIKKASGVMSGMNDSTLNLILIMGGIAAAVGPVLIIIGTLMTVLAGLSLAVAAPIVAVAALIGAFVWAYSEFEWFRDAIDQIMGVISDLFSTAFKAIEGIVEDTLGRILEWWDKDGEAIKSIAEDVTSVLTVVFEGFKAAFVAIVGSLKVVWGQIESFVGSMVDGLLGAISTIVALINGDWAGAWESFMGVLESAGDGLKAIGLIVVEVITATFTWITTWINTVFGTELTTSLSGLWKQFADWINDVWQSITDGAGLVITAAQGMMTGIVSSITDKVDDTKEAATTIAAGILSSITDKAEAIGDAAIGIGNSLVTAMSDKTESIKSTTETIMAGIGTAITNASSGISTAANTIKDSIKTIFTSISLSKIGKEIIQGLLDGMKSMADDVVNWTKDFGNSIGDGFKDVFGINSPSRLMRSYGQFIGEGLALGMEDNTGMVNSAMGQMTAGIGGELKVPAMVGPKRQEMTTTQQIIMASNSRNNNNTPVVKIITNDNATDQLMNSMIDEIRITNGERDGI